MLLGGSVFAHEKEIAFLDHIDPQHIYGAELIQARKPVTKEWILDPNFKDFKGGPCLPA